MRKVRGMMFMVEETPEDSEEGSLRSPEIDENLLPPLSPTGGGSNVTESARACSYNFQVSMYTKNDRSRFLQYIFGCANYFILLWIAQWTMQRGSRFTLHEYQASQVPDETVDTGLVIA